MRLSLLIAFARNRVIGSDGTLPWRLSADLRRFKRLTMGHAIIMGRKTFDSIGRPLPGRTSIVITRQAGWQREGTLVAASLAEAIRLAGDSDEAFIVGGGQIYAEALPLVDRMYITAVQTDVPGDTFFPMFDESEWRLVDESWHAADAKNSYASRFLVYDRIRSASPPQTRNTVMTQSVESQLLDLTWQLLKSIGAKDWEAYTALCADSLTCFEAEARGHLVEGLEFHRYYFGLPAGSGSRNTTLSSPHVRMLGDDAAVVSYVRLTQFIDASGQPQTSQTEETRVWHKQAGRWKHVHFHRSHNT